mgnify:FL=1
MELTRKEIEWESPDAIHGLLHNGAAEIRRLTAIIKEISDSLTGEVASGESCAYCQNMQDIADRALESKP